MNQNQGIIYGIGVGPGDPELMTIRAVKLIKSCDVVCLPQSSKENCRAYEIAEAAVHELANKECLFLDFPMTKDEEKMRRLHLEAYGKMKRLLTEGKNLAFLTIGDPLIYSTFMYILKLAETDGVPVEIVNGITSFGAVSVSLGVPLCEGEENLHIISGQGDLTDTMSLSGTKVIMKCGRNIPHIKEILKGPETEGRIKVYAVSDCGMGNAGSCK